MAEEIEKVNAWLRQIEQDPNWLEVGT